MTGIEAFLEILHRSGVKYIFGNPGTTELPLNDALAKDARFEYIFALQEIPLVAAADGYAMASGGLGVVCVHISCGLGNAMGMLYNAHCEGTPLLVLAGQQDRRLLFDEPVLASDTVAVARPWTKCAVEVHRVQDVPNAVRRAVQTAMTPPTGPVFLSLPLDLQLEQAEGLDVRPPCLSLGGARPARDALERGADILTAARHPAIVAGGRVLEGGAVGELVALAETLGAPVFSEATTMHGRLPMPADHPLYAGALPLWSPDVRKALQPFDTILVVGANLFRLYIHHEPANPLPEHVRLVHLDVDPRQIGKNHPVEVGILGDLRAGLAELTEMARARLSGEQCQSAVNRVREHGRRRQEERSALRTAIDQQRGSRPMTALTFMDTLVRVLPADTAVVEEAITTHNNLFERLGFFRDPSGHFAHRGWALGWGLGCALGVKLAWPGRPVVALLGDGSALYGIQGLWTAAHHRIPVIFLIANNTQYKILKVCGEHLPLPQMAKGNYLAMDLHPPEIDFVSLARAFGVEAHRVREPEELEERIGAGLASARPLLLDVVIAK